ncbi:MAG TPA: methyltransferase domain-containing protein [Streptosporangiaceae bacterium]|jgi:SAM-dependent methyltransferase
MSFEVAADAYQQFMGRYSDQLAVAFADLAGVVSGQRALDVGCGPGALTAELVRRLGSDAVSAAEPSASFAAAARLRLPGVDIRQASAERLPFADGMVDVALAQLVVHFMTDPIAGLREMSRVTAAGGTVAACVWDHRGGRGPVGPFWRAARELDSAVDDESGLPGAREGDLARLFTEAGVADVQSSTLSVTGHYDSFEEWWKPYTTGVGPAGAYVATLTDEHRTALRDRCRHLYPTAPFTITATTWAVTGRA